MVPLTTASMVENVPDFDAVIGNSHLTPNQYNNAADAPLQPLLKAARVEQIEDNHGPEPPVLMLPNFQNNSKKLSALTARVEQVEDNDGPEPAIAMISGFQDGDNKGSAFPDISKSTKSFPLIGGQQQDVAVSGSNIETTDSFTFVIIPITLLLITATTIEMMSQLDIGMRTSSLLDKLGVSIQLFVLTQGVNLLIMMLLTKRKVV